MHCRAVAADPRRPTAGPNWGRDVWNLSALEIMSAPNGQTEDGRELLLVKNGESGCWVFRCSHLGNRREMRLGRWSAAGGSPLVRYFLVLI
jgi:hypothetical protein